MEYSKNKFKIFLNLHKIVKCILHIGRFKVDFGYIDEVSGSSGYVLI